MLLCLLLILTGSLSEVPFIEFELAFGSMLDDHFFISSDVRSKAFQAVDQFLQIVKQYHEKVGYLNSSKWHPSLFDYELVAPIMTPLTTVLIL